MVVLLEPYSDGCSCLVDAQEPFRIEHEEVGRLSEIEAVVYVTVFLSIILHGATAPLFSKRYGDSAAAKADSGGS